MALEFDKFFGLPAHPLLVHVPIVILPLCAAGTVAMAWPGWRRRIGWIVVALTGIAVVAVQLAISSGEALQEAAEARTPERLLEHHRDVAEQVRPFTVLFFFAVAGLMVWDWYARRQATREATAESAVAKRSVRLALVGLSALLALASTIGIVRAGHTGADATWGRVKITGEGGEGREGGDD